jgi:hypothetical protein
MKSKYEIINIGKSTITVDVSLLTKTEEMYFNATDMAKPFGKKPVDFLRIESTKEYIEEVFKGGDSHLKNFNDLVQIKRGKYGGTFLHNELAFEFAGWCSPLFRRHLHKWAAKRLKQEHEWKQNRLESKTGFLPMTNAVLHAHDPVKHFHFSNEADLINDIVLGMKAKAFKQKYGVKNVRDYIDAAQLSEIERLQIINTGLIEIGMEYQKRKKHLKKCHERGLLLLGHEHKQNGYREVS